MTENKNSQQTIQKAKIRHNKRISPFWLLPIIAFCIGAILFFQIIKEQGETIHITFNTGDGLVANKTQIRYQGLQIGVVKRVNFTEDLKNIEVEANIYPEGKTLLRKDTRFWLVQPTATLAGISGLDTLISGNYITLQPGIGEKEDRFIADDDAPITQQSDGDLLIYLKAEDLGSISEGASVFYKKIPVGTVLAYRFSSDKKSVEIQLVIDKKYANLVKKDSRFWNISGINASVGFGGVKLEMDSLASVVQGAVTFDSPEASEQAEQNQTYTLYPNLLAAKRGIGIDVLIPNSEGLRTGFTGVFYQNIQVGILAQLEENRAKPHISGQLLIDPSIEHLLKTNTQLVLRFPKINLANVASYPTVLRGPYIDILPGNGEQQHQFEVLKEIELLLKQPNTLLVTLTAPETFGVNEGQKLFYNNIVIGDIVKVEVEPEKAQFTLAIAEAYRYLLHSDSQFIANSHLEMTLGADGLKFNAAPPEQWLEGGIRLINHKHQGQPLNQYPLYKNMANAEAGITESGLKPSITLTSTQLPSISKGSVVLYRQFEVGEILAVRPQKNHFDIDVGIYPKYQHLLTTNSRFWVENAAEVDISAQGIRIQAAPLSRTFKGAISFDNSGKGSGKILYISELRAKSAGQELTLMTTHATNLNQGMPLRYMGLEVGQIESIRLNNKTQKIEAKALINGEYMAIVAKEGSQFTVISPQISAGGIENIDSLLRPYIDISVGSGKTKTQFNLLNNDDSQYRKFQNGFPFILETNNALNISEGVPVLYRGIEVGKVMKMELNKLGDRVLVHINVAQKYHHLVRKNTEFWIDSGYTASLGWSGMEINTGSVQQLLKGGISFSTPNSTVIQPEANKNQRFLLQVKKPENGREWHSGVIAE